MSAIFSEIPLSVAADTFHETEIVRLFQFLREFLGQERINVAGELLTKEKEDGNPFRSQLLDEKQPWIASFIDFKEVLSRSNGEIPRDAISDRMLMTCYLASMLERALPSIPENLRQQFRARLLDLHGRSNPLVMELENACFYLRRKFDVAWTDKNEKGPEFRATFRNNSIDVECARFKRNWLEVLNDAHACNLAFGAWQALADVDASGIFLLEVPFETLPSTPEIRRICGAALTSDTKVSRELELPNVGKLTRVSGSQNCRLDSREQIQIACSSKPHYCRSVGAGPMGKAGGGVVLWLSGMRRSTADFVTHISNELLRKALTQLRPDVPGVLVAEVEDISDPNLYATKKPFYDIAAAVFKEAPWTAGIVWRCGLQLEQTADGVGFVHYAFNLRNRSCCYPQARQLPILDEPSS